MTCVNILNETSRARFLAPGAEAAAVGGGRVTRAGTRGREPPGTSRVTGPRKPLNAVAIPAAEGIGWPSAETPLFPATPASWKIPLMPGSPWAGKLNREKREGRLCAGRAVEQRRGTGLRNRGALTPPGLPSGTLDAGGHPASRNRMISAPGRRGREGDIRRNGPPPHRGE